MENSIMIIASKVMALKLTVGNKMHKAFPLLVRKFPLPEGTSHCLKKNATARRKEIPLPEDCTAVIVKKKLKHKTARVLWAAILKTFGGNEATKKTKKNLLKQQYGNFRAEGSKTLEKTFFRLQVIVGQLQFMGVEVQQDDLNQNFLNSLAPEWLMHTIVWRNRTDLDTMSLDDLYNHLKVYESEVQKKSKPNTHNIAFISSVKHIRGNDEVNTASVYTASSNVPTASANVSTISISQETTWKKISIQGSDVAGFDKSKVECFNCHKIAYFARECRALRNQDRGRRDTYRQGSKAEEQAPKALMEIDGVGWDWRYMENDEEDHALVANEEKNNDSLNSKIIDLTDKLFDANNMIYHYKTLEYYNEGKKECIEPLRKELENLKKEKKVVNGKLAGLLTASKDLDNLIESQRSDKSKEGLGYTAVLSPTAQLYLSPKKDLSWTSLPECADDTVTDYSRPSPTVENSSKEDQNRNPSTFENVASPITPKPFIKFVKASDSQSKSKTDEKETPKKPPVKDAKQYKKPNKKPNIKGNQTNWNNLKSHQLDPDFVMKKKACFNCGDFNHLAYECRKRVKRGTTRSQNNTYKSPSQRPVAHRPNRSPIRSIRPNMNCTCSNRTSFNKSAHSYTNRPFQKRSAVRSQYRAPWVPTVNRNFPPVNRKFSTGSRNFPTANKKFSTAGRKFPTCSTKSPTADIGMKGKAVKPSACWSWKSSQNLSNKGPKNNNGSSQNRIDDKGYWDSGCSRMYSVGKRLLTCLVAKKSADECNLWHRRLGHLNFKTMNKLVRHNLVRGLPTKCFENDHNCTACLKGKQHKASCKSKLVTSMSKPLHTLHMVLFGPTSVSSISHKWYCLVVTDDFSRVLVNKAHNKTPYELFNGRTPAIGFLKPFGCHVMILNTLDNLGEFEAKGDEGYFIGYSMSSKAFRVFNKRTNRVKENLHIEFLENKAIEKGSGPNWLFDIDSLTKSMNYVPVVDACINSTDFSGTKVDARKDVKKDVSSLRYIVLPNWVHEEHLESTSSEPQDACNTDAPESSGNSNLTATLTNPPADQLETLTVETSIPTVSSPVLTVCFTDSQEPLSETRLISKRVTNQEETPSLDNILTLSNQFEDILGVTTTLEESNGVEADVSNMETTITASPTPTLRIHRDHPKNQIISPVDTPIQTRNKSKEEELLQFKIQKVWSLVNCPKGVRPIGTKWVLKNKKDERGIVIRNKSRLVAQGHTQEEWIDYNEVFAPVSRIEAIRLFLAYASFIGFTVYQMDVKSAFLFGRRLISWQCKKQKIVATSTTKAEYVAAASCCGQVLWIQNQLLDYGLSMSCETLSEEISTSILRLLQLCDYHNMVAILEKSEHNADFHPIVDFVEASPLRYALTFKPTIYVSHIRQFWSTARSETTEEGTQILATVDGVLRTVTESSLRRNLKLQDEEGISSLPDTELFENLTLMGYNISPNQKFTFQKGIPTEPHHTPSQEAQPSSPTHISSPSIPTVTQYEPTPLRQYTRRSTIAQSSALPPVADEPASPVRDDSQGEACPIDSGFVADQDRATIVKSSTLPHDSAPREVEINKLNAGVKILKDNQGVIGARSGDDALIEGRRIDKEEVATERLSSHTEEVRLDEGEAAAERTSEDTEEMATVLTTMDATTVLASGATEVPTGSGSIPTAGTEVPTGSDVVPTASPIFATATVVTPYRRRKGKKVMVESETPKKQKLQEQIDAQIARELKEKLEREDQRRAEQIARDAEIARIHAEEEL
nr:hypothetical protein [Tanacetum cinerariifolium]